VRLSGLEVGRDIEIRYTGIRPGERLYEEPFFRHEEVLPTAHSKILRATDNHVPADVGAAIELLVAAGRASCPDEELRSLLKKLVPDFGRVPPTDEPRERSRAAPAARVRRGHAPAPRLRVERRTRWDRRATARRAQAIAVSIDHRMSGDRRSGLDRRAAVPTVADKSLVSRCERAGATR